MAGYFVPRIWNDFAKCISVPRIHTSLMVFPDTVKLGEAIRQAYPWFWKRDGNYCPCDPFSPSVAFKCGGKPIFWDTCANLYNMLLSLEKESVLRKLSYFTPAQLECYDHLNSASFYDVMSTRLEGVSREGFIRSHDEWVKNPRPGLWPLVNEYYWQKSVEGLVKQPIGETLKA